MEKILFVCTGNTCRSSMTEALFRVHMEKDPGLCEKFCVGSAGLQAFEGDPASRNSILALKRGWDIDLGSHRARKLSPADIADSHLIFTMTRAHKEAIIERFPEYSGKVFTLTEYVSENPADKASCGTSTQYDIADPYGMPYDVYMECARQLNEAVDKLAAKLRKIT